METPTTDDVRAALGGLDAHQQKIVVGLLSVMVNEPQRVREREWLAERLTELTLLTGEFEADTPQGGVQAVEAYLLENSGRLLRAAMLLFQRVGIDLAPRAKAGGFTFEDAVQTGLAYMPGATAR